MGGSAHRCPPGGHGVNEESGTRMVGSWAQPSWLFVGVEGRALLHRLQLLLMDVNHRGLSIAGEGLADSRHEA
jgi:hypothetical protein